jgi:hypothetical protein
MYVGRDRIRVLVAAVLSMLATLTVVATAAASGAGGPWPR